MSVDPEFSTVPRAYHLVKDDSDRQVLELYLLPWEFNHSFMLPPGAPGATLSAWRAAFDKAVNEPAYLADAAKRLQRIEPRSGQEVQGLVDKLYATPKEIVDRTNAVTSSQK